MKKVVYLFGAGATKGEATFQGNKGSILMEDINRNVLDLSRKKKGKYFNFMNSISVSPDDIKKIDIELIISLVDGYINPDLTITNEIKELFKEYLESQLNTISPKLITALLKLNKDYSEEFNGGEKLTGILTINYDDLIEKSIEIISPNEEIILLKLHGSFHDGTWLPPGIFKNPYSTEEFRRTWKKADSLLSECDILRIIGASLRKEDISLLSLIFNTQIKNKFDIEFIAEDKKTRDLWENRLPFIGNIRLLNETYGIDTTEENFRSNHYLSWLLKIIHNIREKNQKVLNEEIIKEIIGEKDEI